MTSARLVADVGGTITRLDLSRDGELEAGGDGQALVVGVGTGFNVSPVIISNGRVESLDVEYGHFSLPVDIAEIPGV